jgi:hypothetical protein
MKGHCDNGGFQILPRFMIVSHNHYTHSPSSKERSKKHKENEIRRAEKKA